MGDVAPEFGATKINLMSLNAFDYSFFFLISIILKDPLWDQPV